MQLFNVRRFAVFNSNDLINIIFTENIVTKVIAVVIIIISEFTQQDGRKKRTAERSCVTNVTRLFLTCFVVIFT